MELLPGDVIYKDSDQTGAKIVKFFMTAPTIWHHIWRAIKNKQEKVSYYHPGMYIGAVARPLVIEQQWKVEFKKLDDMLGVDEALIIIRRANLSQEEQEKLVAIAQADLGQKWGVIHALFGRFLTWLTGISLFARYIKLPNNEVSAGRVARWYYEAFGETFGHKTYKEATTHTMVKHCLSNPEKYEVVEVRK